jgi:prepilin signal peptidase PulO-like enzyme (type II secretory pathway)
MIDMPYAWGLLAGLFGLVIGSFLNVVINRLRAGQSLNGRSCCPKCKHILGVLDLVPVCSFMYLGGKCRYCGAKISWQYPAVELVTALSFFLVVINSSMDTLAAMLFKLVFVSILIVVAVYDLKHYLILDKVVLPAAVLGLVYAIYQGEFVSGVIGVAIVSGFFLFQYLVSQGRWIGLGDVKLGLFLGWILGWAGSIVMLMLGYWVGAMVAIYLIASGKKQMASRVPFGLFLAGSAIITLIYGQEIADWYLTLIGFNRPA